MVPLRHPWFFIESVQDRAGRYLKSDTERQWESEESYHGRSCLLVKLPDPTERSLEAADSSSVGWLVASLVYSVS